MSGQRLTLRKSLGQHFLRDENISRKIIEGLKQQHFQQLLEVGAGGGALTKYLVEIKDIDLKVVEIDNEKINFLLHAFPALQHKIIHNDFLEIEKPFPGKFAVIGNFPYHISSQILFKILGWKEDIDFMIGMFQKEVAQRIAAKEGNKVYGVLSVLVQAFFKVEYLFEVNEQSFYPPPKVKSAVIMLTPKKEKPNIRTEKDFSLLVKAAFNQRRKTLRNAVKNLFDIAVLQDSIFGERAEQLTVNDFAALTWKMKK
ncbi:MAG TPA: 16S rRNA (adenine(1518)-N(6)/adenine(1519)-N(6))-dimethyltransferase RsmA [Puia sp.]|nr:16S rRNA (adenine(1518)-N(6)/adenine(1519)-N(6))-dimethyltransferase RsmA [Puia sp.]